MKNTGILVMGSLSIFYIATILVFRSNDAWELLSVGNLNELGDFLAGFFTPLAFGWLVFGYLLQTKELRLQRQELALTRVQLGTQTELLQEQVTADYHDSIPHLTIRIASPENWWDWIVENKGGVAKNVELWNLDLEQKVAERNSLASNESFPYTVAKTDPAQYEARFSSDGSERFRQCWKMGEGKCKQITQGPERISTQKPQPVEPTPKRHRGAAESDKP